MALALALALAGQGPFPPAWGLVNGMHSHWNWLIEMCLWGVIGLSCSMLIGKSPTRSAWRTVKGLGLDSKIIFRPTHQHFDLKAITIIRPTGSVPVHLLVRCQAFPGGDEVLGRYDYGPMAVGVARFLLS